jgi:flagellar motility protein MotE (MotC chaperone)
MSRIRRWEKEGMFHKERGVDNSSMLIHCGVALLALVIVTPHTLAQKAPRKPKAKSANATPKVSKEEAKELAEAASQSRANLLSASSDYRASLENLLVLQRQDESRAAEMVGKRKELLVLGVISKRELEEGERALADAQGRIAETMKKIADVDHLVAEVNAAEELAKTSAERPGIYRSAGLLVRYVGASRWALSDIAKVDAFFRLKFGRPLPVSAVGQTETHNQLGFDHREAIDVAVRPDSSEGQALIGYLTSQGVSFTAIRGAIRGSATGAHIHIGPPSKRISAH